MSTALEPACPHCKDPIAVIEYRQIEAWYRQRFAGGREEGEFHRVVKQPTHGKCSQCGKRVRL